VKLPRQDERNYTFSIQEKKEHNLRHPFPYPHPAIVNRRLDSASNPSLVRKGMLIYDQLEPFWSSPHFMSFQTSHLSLRKCHNNRNATHTKGKCKGNNASLATSFSVQKQDTPPSKLYEKQTTTPIANAGFCAARFASVNANAMQ
jgi:hypothetical protein